MYGNHPMRPSKEELSDAFYAFDKLLVSVGKVICNYGEVGGEWIPIDSGNNLYIPNTCSTLTGSSGGVMILLKEQEPAGAFIGFHTRGHFIPCKDCLKVVPSQRSHVYESKDLAGCESCQTDCRSNADLDHTLAFNFGMSVHHPAFKAAYKKHILPTIVEAERPDFLNRYLNQDE